MKNQLLILLFFFILNAYGQQEYLPVVSWRTNVINVVMLSDSTYRVSISPININEPGGIQPVIGNYLKDFIGHTYQIIDSASTTIDVKDVFNVGVGPQTDRQGVVYRSVGNGMSPYIAPIRYDHLDKSAFDYSRSIELAVLWKYATDTLDYLRPFRETTNLNANDTLLVSYAFLDSLLNNMDTANWNLAYNWGDHSIEGYLLSESDPVFGGHTTSSIIDGVGFLKNNGAGIWAYDTTNFLNTSFSYNTITRELSITDGGGVLSSFLPIVSDEYPGLMSASDKNKLNSLSANSNTIQVSQTAHGFVVGDWIRNSATGHLKAQANLPVNADVIGRVTEVIDVNTFVYQYGGVLSGTFTNGANYFLSTATAGAAVTSQSYSDGQVQVFLGTGTADGLLLNIGTGVEISTDTYVTTDQLKTDVYNEVPTGTINGTNAAFTIANTPVSGSVRVYLNGLREKLTSNYSVSGTTITFVTAPETGDEILVDYKY